MNAWNLISFMLVCIALIEAYQNNWNRPKLVSWATIAGLWLVGTFALWLVS
jgi:hypothetical protein